MIKDSPSPFSLSPGLDLGRLLAARALWFLPEASLAGQPLRPVSIASWHAMKLMGLTLFDAAPVAEREGAEIAVFFWLHHRAHPIPEIKAAIWDGSWREITAALPALPDSIVNEFRFLRAGVVDTIRAARTRIIPRPRSTSASDPIPPDDLTAPGRLVTDALCVRRETGLPWEQCLWDFPYAQALGILHASDWTAGAWTVPDPDGDRPLATPGDFTDFSLPGDE